MYTTVDIFYAFFTKRSLVVFGRTSVGRNHERTSVVGEMIKSRHLNRGLEEEEETTKFAKSAENFRDCGARKLNMFVFRKNKKKSPMGMEIHLKTRKIEQIH